MKDYSIFLISNKPERYPKIQESLLPELLYYFDGTNGPTYSTLVNRCVEASHTETVIILGHKVYPKTQDIQKMVSLINQGYGLVGLRKFGFYGFKKELLRRIGMFDERFVGGGWEDNDIVLRMIVSNIAFYLTEEVEYHEAPSSWDYSKSVVHFVEKWRHDWENNINGVPLFSKVMTEEKYNYNLGPSVPTQFLPCREFSYTPTILASYLHTKVDSKVPLDYVNVPL